MQASDYVGVSRYDVSTATVVAMQQDLDTIATSGRWLTRTAPHWADRLYLALVVYVVACAFLMLSGLGGKQFTHYVGLFSDAPADLAAGILAFAAARRTRPGCLRQAWTCLAIALGLYFTGTVITVVSWLHGVDPFPGWSDVFFSAFYPAMLIAALLLVRAAAIRVPWIQLCLDAAIFILGFGTFFWFLVIHPANGTSEVDTLKQGLSEAYASLDCLVLLVLGVPLLTGVGGRKIPLLLMAGFAAMFLADVFWSLAKLRGYYAAGEVQDVFYVACHLPWAAAAREQMRTPLRSRRTESNESDALARALPHAALFTALFVLVYLTRGDIGGPAALMTTVVFALTLLLMIRQGVVLRGDAAVREKRAARMVEDRFASLIANASDVIMIVESDGTLRFVSPAC
ncbi:MAG TPA: hypothetical protein VGC34_07580, partial [Steroidobacteraceae bacterium]